MVAAIGIVTGCGLKIHMRHENYLVSKLVLYKLLLHCNSSLTVKYVKRLRASVIKVGENAHVLKQELA